MVSGSASTGPTRPRPTASSPPTAPTAARSPTPTTPTASSLSATGPAGTRTYRWAEGLIAAVVDADGVVEVENVYDAEGRVTSQRSPFGRTTRYVYLPGRTTVVSDEDGTRSNTWLHDDRGRLIGVVDADEQRQSTSYDRWGNRVLLTERDGQTTVHEYDARGRRVRTVTPSGADVTYGYDDLDRVTTVVTEQGAVTTYTYEGEQRNPSTILDPEGGLSRLVWADGLLTEIVDPTDVVVRFSYDAHGDLVGTTNALGSTARLERDDLGRVTAAITPSGHTTTYTYDPASGLLAERRNPDGGIWRYEYTAGGRLAATIDPLGSRTSVEYGPHGEEAATIDPLGRAITRQLDDLGNLASVELPDGSRWEFTHDALSRLDRHDRPDRRHLAPGVRPRRQPGRLDRRHRRPRGRRPRRRAQRGRGRRRRGVDAHRLRPPRPADEGRPGRRLRRDLHLRPLRAARRGARRRRRPARSSAATPPVARSRSSPPWARRPATPTTSAAASSP